MNTKQIEREVVDHERQYWRALKDKDYETALRMTDDPCIVVGPQGVNRIDEATFRATMGSENYTIRDYALDDSAMEVIVLAPDIAVVAYKVHEDLTVDGKPLALDANESSTWIRRDGGWRCVMHSEALAGDPFGRDRRPS
jgi:ketosteroid isomerase-like protein